MKLSERHIFKGYWWLPDKPNDRVAGVLTYTPGEKILLELIGGFETENEPLVDLINDENKNASLIYGIDSNAKEISLLFCFRSFSFNFSSEFPMVRYTVRMVVHDKHVSGLEEVCDYTAHVRYPELSYWAYPSAIQQTFRFNAEGDEIASCSFLLSYSATEAICTIDCDNGVQLSINKGTGCQPDDLLLKPELEQYSYLKFNKPKMGMSINEIFHEIIKFGRFLSLATKRDVRPESIYLTDTNVRKDYTNGQKSYYFPIYILYVQIPVSQPTKLDRNNFLFRYEDLADRIPELLKNWMSDTDNLRPIKNHLVDSLVYKPVVGSVDYLQVIQAIEGVWWRFKENEYRNTHPKTRKPTPLATIISEVRNSLSSIPSIAKMELDVETVVDSRVYYTHFVDISERPKALDGWELYELTKKTRTILLCLVLELLGLNHDEIERILVQQG